MHSFSWSRSVAVQISVVILSLLTAFQGFSQTNPAVSIDRDRLEAWTDGAMGAFMESHRTAGAVISVVKDGELLFSKGYGYADYETREKVDPEKTLFRIASISKLFVWTAVMQLVEQGKIDLQVDINEYLDGISVPEKYDKPVTMANLMTHTPGFEDHVIGLFSDRGGQLPSLKEVLQDEMPKRVREPGRFASYSNHGTGLAALIVEEVSGVPWERYIQENILNPLDMQQISFSQPLPDSLTEDLSKGYRYRGSVFVEEPFEFMALGPVGCGSAAADAMAKFMIAHLQLGEYNGARILEEASARLMHSELNRMAPGMASMAHGFWDTSRNGVRILSHGGKTIWFHSELALFPEHDLGLFVSFNTDAGAAAKDRFANEFIDHFFPVEGPEILVPPADFDARAERFAGSYRANRYSHSTFAKLAALISGVRVSPSGDGALLLGSTGKKRWIEVAPLTFREEFGHDKIIFVEDDKGRITHLLLGGQPTAAFDRVKWFGDPSVHQVSFLVSMLLFLWTIVLWPCAAILRWRHDVMMTSDERFSTVARVVAWASCLTSVTFLVWVGSIMSDPNQIAFAVPPLMNVLLWLPVAILVLTIACAVFTFFAWREGQGRFFSRVYYTVLTFVSFVFVWQTFYWNLFGPWNA